MSNKNDRLVIATYHFMYSHFNIKGCKHWANDVLWEYNKIFTKKVGIFVKEVEIFSLDEENYLYD